jgi:hypothetical protein
MHHRGSKSPQTSFRALAMKHRQRLHATAWNFFALFPEKLGTDAVFSNSLLRNFPYLLQNSPPRVHKRRNVMSKDMLYSSIYKRANNVTQLFRWFHVPKNILTFQDFTKD